MVERLDESAHSAERRRLSDLGNLILQAVRKTHVQAVPESGIAPVNLSRKLLELGEVSSAGFVFLHPEYGKLHFRVSDRIVNSEVVLQDSFKLIPVGHPGWFPVAFLKKVRFEPFQRRTLQVRDGIVHPIPIVTEGLRFRSKYQVQLNKECSKLLRI